MAGLFVSHECVEHEFEHNVGECFSFDPNNRKQGGYENALDKSGTSVLQQYDD